MAMDGRTLRLRQIKFKLENDRPVLTMERMRKLPAMLLGLTLVLSGCESSSDAYVPGRIPKERAIAIAMEANRQYPYPLSKYSAVWRPNSGYWSVEFRDEDDEFGKFYLVDAKGRIVGRGRMIHGEYQ
jgi:hypothetical protein